MSTSNQKKKTILRPLKQNETASVPCFDLMKVVSLQWQTHQILLPLIMGPISTQTSSASKWLLWQDVKTSAKLPQLLLWLVFGVSPADGSIPQRKILCHFWQVLLNPFMWDFFSPSVFFLKNYKVENYMSYILNKSQTVYSDYCSHCFYFSCILSHIVNFKLLKCLWIEFDNCLSCISSNRNPLPPIQVSIPFQSQPI